MLTLDAIRVLDAIARRGSFAGAAEELDRAPSAISYSVQKLEEETGILLFDRAGRKATLTAAGESVLTHGRRLLTDAEALVTRAHAVESGWEPQVTLALDVIYTPSLLWPLVEQFDQVAPNTRLRVISEALDGSLESLLAGRAAISIAHIHGRVPAGIRTRLIDKIKFIYVASPDHPATREIVTDARELSRHRAIAVADTARLNPGRTLRLSPHQPVLTLSNFEDKTSALCAGLGIGTLPEHRARPLIASGKLVALKVQADSPEQPVYMAWRPDMGGKALHWLTRHLPACISLSAMGR